MYTSFYNLSEKPFTLSTSPGFLYLGKAHKEALAMLTYGIIERKSFVLLTGEPGIGKTTLLHSLIKNLDSSIRCVYLPNPALPSDDFLSYIAYRLGLKKQSKSKGFFLIQFEALLKYFLQRNQATFLIIDEAQELSFELMEEIRMLSNMELEGKRLIHIFLVGQPSLNKKLNSDRCRSLLQRINVRYHIFPLNLLETDSYIKGHLKNAGCKNPKLFSKDSIILIHKYSKGIPRIINILCDNSLLLGYSIGKKQITPGMIKECYDDLQPPGQAPQEDVVYEDIKKLGKVKAKKSFLKAAIIVILLCVLLFIAGSFTSTGKKYLSRAKQRYSTYFKTGSFSKIKSSSSMIKKPIAMPEKEGGEELLNKANTVRVKIRPKP